MRYVNGHDMRDLLRAKRPLPPAEALYLVGQCGRALDYAHRHSLVHRDVKPANLLVEAGVDDEDPDHVFLADFGITKHALSRTGLTPTGQFMGTLDYVAPEQIQGKEVGQSADIYSLGCVLYEGLTGQVPFVKEIDAAVLWAHVEEAASPPSSINAALPAGLDSVMERALSKNPADRYATCHDMVADARAALATTGSPRPRPVPSCREVAHRPRRPSTAAGLTPAGSLGSLAGHAGRSGACLPGGPGSPPQPATGRVTAASRGTVGRRGPAGAHRPRRRPARATGPGEHDRGTVRATGEALRRGGPGGARRDAAAGAEAAAAGSADLLAGQAPGRRRCVVAGARGDGRHLVRVAAARTVPDGHRDGPRAGASPRARRASEWMSHSMSPSASANPLAGRSQAGEHRHRGLLPADSVQRHRNGPGGL